MREHLIALVRGVQKRAADLQNADPDRGAQWLAMALGDPDQMCLVFGRGYFDGDKVMVYGPQRRDPNGVKLPEPGELLHHNMPVGDAVDLFIAHYGLG